MYEVRSCYDNVIAVTPDPAAYVADMRLNIPGIVNVSHRAGAVRYRIYGKRFQFTTLRFVEVK